MNALWTILPHSAFVHMPLALAVLWPLAYALAWWTTSRGIMPDPLWYGIIGLGVIEVGSSLTGVFSGEAAKVASGAKADLLHHHEELAEIFMGAWWALFALIVLTWWFRKTEKAPWLHGITLAALTAQAVFAMVVGHAGGALL